MVSVSTELLCRERSLRETDQKSATEALDGVLDQQLFI